MSVLEAEKAERIDKYLTSCLDLSRSKVQQLLKNGNITVNNKDVKSNYMLKVGDVIEVQETNSVLPPTVKEENIPLDIVFEDDDLAIINKQSGMVVHPAAGNYEHTLVNALLYHFQMDSKDTVRPGIVHRLDKDTSGLMLVAKNDKMHDLLSEMIKNKEVERYYQVLVEGVIPNDTGTIDAPVGRDEKNRLKMAVTSVNSKKAVTHFKVLKRYLNETLLMCKLETGRTHQIRVHMAYIGHPVVNDPLYNKKEATPFGQMLHSYQIKLIHPKTKEVLEFTVDPPEEFQEKINCLEGIE